MLIKTETSYGLDGSWFEFRQGTEVFSSPKTSTPIPAPNQPPVQQARYFLWVKRPGREVDHSPPSYAEVKNEWRRASAPYILPHGLDRDLMLRNLYSRYFVLIT